MPIKLDKTVDENNGYIIEAEITDYDEVTLVGSAAIDTASGSLIDKTTDTVLATYADLKPNISAEGLFKKYIPASENGFQNEDRKRRTEIHVFKINISGNNGIDDVELEKEIWITVNNNKYG